MAGEGPWTGCTPSVTFSSKGARTLTAKYTMQNGRSNQQSVNVTVVDPTPVKTVVVSITKPALPYVVGTYSSSAAVDFTGTVTVNGSSASCATLKWSASKSGSSAVSGTGCAPTLTLPIGVWNIAVSYDDGSGGVGSASGQVTVRQLVIG